ncbi:hypothetical protein CMI47_01215 [Candidatus Pacearchaeota archaeon]|nr:hypothetical protein [Candidatus Pacearchaeota archaeon]|tara:strand:- start:1912 stop:3909 length:1998 start_codon:yes stop_codon:yes gene_type:complete
MNGDKLALGVVAAIAAAGLASRRGSRSSLEEFSDRGASFEFAFTTHGTYMWLPTRGPSQHVENPPDFPRAKRGDVGFGEQLGILGYTPHWNVEGPFQQSRLQLRLPQRRHPTTNEFYWNGAKWLPIQDFLVNVESLVEKTPLVKVYSITEAEKVANAHHLKRRGIRSLRKGSSASPQTHAMKLPAWTLRLERGTKALDDAIRKGDRRGMFEGVEDTSFWTGRVVCDAFGSRDGATEKELEQAAKAILEAEKSIYRARKSLFKKGSRSMLMEWVVPEELDQGEYEVNRIREFKAHHGVYVWAPAVTQRWGRLRYLPAAGGTRDTVFFTPEGWMVDTDATVYPGAHFQKLTFEEAQKIAWDHHLKHRGIRSLLKGSRSILEWVEFPDWPRPRYCVGAEVEAEETTFSRFGAKFGSKFGAKAHHGHYVWTEIPKSDGLGRLLYLFGGDEKMELLSKKLSLEEAKEVSDQHHLQRRGVRGGSRSKRFFQVNSPTQGLKVIKDKAITDNWKKSLRVRRKNPVAVLLPCAGTKPFPEAPSHKHGYLEALDGLDVDLYVVSEPLGVVPYAWSRTWPNDSYDFPPKHLKGEGRDLLVERIGEWLDKVGTKYQTVISALPIHHRKLVTAANDGDLKIVDASMTACRNGSCSDRSFRATSDEYKKWLRRKVQSHR